MTTVENQQGLRRSVGKAFEYLCWVIVASTMSLAFQKEWLEWLVLGVVYGNEIMSIIGNYLECKGIELSMVDFYRWIFRKGAAHIGADVSEEEAGQIIKPTDKQDTK